MAPVRSTLITIRNNAPWYSDEIAIAKRLRRKLEQKWRRSRLECDRLEYIPQCGMVNQLLRSTKEAYYSKFIEENSTDSRKLFKSVNMLLNRNLDACYPAGKGDTDLAGAFADFFMQKIDRIRSEINVGRSANFRPVSNLKYIFKLIIKAVCHRNSYYLFFFFFVHRYLFCM